MGTSNNGSGTWEIQYARGLTLLFTLCLTHYDFGASLASDRRRREFNNENNTSHVCVITGKSLNCKTR
jgi:hypothetical protein